MRKNITGRIRQESLEYNKKMKWLSSHNEEKFIWGPAGATGLEPATSSVTGKRSNQLSYAPKNVTGTIISIY